MKKISLRHKLIRIFVITSLLPIVILGLYSYVNISQTLRDNTEMMAMSALSQTDNNLRISLEAYEDTLYQLYTADDMVKWVEAVDEGTEKAVAINQMRRFMSSLLYSKEFIRSVSVITPGGELVNYEQIAPATYKSSWMDNFQMTETELYSDVIQDYDVHIYPTQFGTKFANRDYYLFHLAHRIIDYHKLEKECGVVIISVDEELFRKVCLSSEDNDRVYNFIVGKDGRIMSFKDEDNMIGMAASSMDKSPDLRKEDYRKFLTENDSSFNSESNVYVFHDEELGWDIVNVTSLSQLMNSLRKQMILIIALSLIILALAISLLTGLSGNLVTSVKRVISRMEQAKSGDLSVRVGKDQEMPIEIEAIVDAFNDMLEKLNVAMTQQQEAQIAALEAQINPHFLYNTLDTINWMAIDRDEYDISNAISALANILRYAIVNSNAEVTVREEMDWLKKYIYLQQYRMKGKFSFSMEVEPEAQNALIHKLLLQPFIENAIKHGFAPDQEDANLKVSVLCKEHELEVNIEDNGRGMDPEMIKDINSGAFTGKEGGANIGIKNAATRLEMYYSKEGSMKVKPDTERGTCIIILIPFKKKQY